jgi:hypothetical protein
VLLAPSKLSWLLCAYILQTDVQSNGWVAIGNITEDNAGNAANASAAGAFETAVATLKRRPAEASVLACACHALSALSNCAADAAKAGACGAIKAVVAALRAFPDDTDVCLKAEGCAALCRMTLQTPDNQPQTCVRQWRG